MHLGRYRLGDLVPARIQTYDVDGVPVAPAACPTTDWYDNAGTNVMAAKSIPIQDRYGVTGVFMYEQILDARFAAGRYWILYKWSSGAFNGQELDTFEVVAGGNAQGQYISTFFIDRPHAKFLIGQTDGGVVDRIRNPKF